MNNATIELLKWMAGIFATAATVFGVVRTAGVSRRTQLEVTHINQETHYADSLQEDVKSLKVDLKDLSERLRASDEKWFAAQMELLGKQKQLNEQEVRIAALETQCVALKDDGLRNRQECEQEIAKMHDEIVALTERCRLLEVERDKWKSKYEIAAGIIGTEETERKSP